MIAFSALLLMAGAPDIVLSPAIVIDPCVQVDTEEVRRLTAIELSGWRPRNSFASLEVVVACSSGGEELRLTDRASGRVTVRSIDLSTPEAGAVGEQRDEARDAKARELALAVAELFRRTDGESPAAMLPAPEAKGALAAPAEARASETGRQAWRVELGTAGAGVYWTGGEVLFGADMTGRVHLNRWLIAELRLGGRKTSAVDVEDASIDGRGMAAAAGLSLDATPGMHRAGVSLGVRLGADWLRYAALDRGTTFAGKDAAAVNLAATATAFLMLSSTVCVIVDAAAGTALHSIVIRDSARRLSGSSGVLVSSAFGLGVHF